MGAKSAELLRMIPDTKVDLIERCSGHGGTFGVMKDTAPLARKVGKPAAKATRPFCSSRCRDVDLNRWLSGSYVVPAAEDDPEEGE